MNHRSIAVRKGQIWEHKKDGKQIVIVGGKGDEWFSDRVGNRNINHHISRFTLAKEWKLMQD